MNPSRRYCISNEPENIGVSELDSWFQRGNEIYSFYTSKILQGNRKFLEEKYDLNRTTSGLWINQQMPVYVPHKDNSKPSHLGFLYLLSEYDIELVFFPGKTNKLGGEDLENRIQRQMRNKLEKEATSQEKPITEPIYTEQLPLPGF